MNDTYLKENLNEILIIMQKIQDLQFFAKENDYLRYIVFDLLNIKKVAKIRPIKEDDILSNLNKWGVINIRNTDREYEESEYRKVNKESNGKEAPIKIINKIFYISTEPKFENFYANIKDLNSQKNCKLIYKKDGEYFFKKETITVNIKSRYFNIFDIIFINTNEEGFISYNEIIKKLSLRGFEVNSDNKINVKSINNAVVNNEQGFFYRGKVNNKRIANITPDGMPIITAIKGEGIKFYNPNLK